MDDYTSQRINERSFYLTSLAFSRMPKAMQKKNHDIWKLVNQHDVHENTFFRHVLETEPGVILRQLGISNNKFFRLKSQSMRPQSDSGDIYHLAVKAHDNVVDDMNNLRPITNGTNETICDLYDKAQIGIAKNLVCELPEDKIVDHDN